MQGLPQFVLPECTDYWDGTQIWSMDPSRRDSVMEVSRQWQQEGMIVHAFSYNPISVKETEIFDMIDVLLGSYEADLLAKAKASPQCCCSSWYACCHSHCDSCQYGTREGLTSSTSTGPNTSPCKPLIGLSVDQSSIFLLAQLANRSNVRFVCLVIVVLFQFSCSRSLRM